MGRRKKTNPVGLKKPTGVIRVVKVIRVISVLSRVIRVVRVSRVMRVIRVGWLGLTERRLVCERERVHA